MTFLVRTTHTRCCFCCTAGDIPAGWIWVYYLNPVAKALIAMSITQFACDTTPCPTIEVVAETVVRIQTKEQYVSEFLDAGFDWYGRMIGYLILTLGVVISLSFIIIKNVRHIKR